MEERYFAEADEAMNNYVAMFEATEQVQKPLEISNVFILNWR